MKTILVLEDESDLRKMIRLLLSSQHIVLEAATPEDAVRRFHEHNGRIDLLIADVVLPGKSGIHVALELRSQNDDLRIILTSGYPQDMWREEDCMQLNELPLSSVTILTKPFFPHTLLKTITALIGPSNEYASAVTDWRKCPA